MLDFMIVLMPYIYLLKLLWIKKMSILRKARNYWENYLNKKKKKKQKKRYPKNKKK